jgi:arginine decarboxylase
VPHPDLVTESGRALVAHHSVLIFNVLDANQMLLGQSPQAPKRNEPRVIKQLWETYDGVSRKNAGEAAGRTRCNRVVNFDPGGRDLLGRVVSVRIVRALPHSLRGELEA